MLAVTVKRPQWGRCRLVRIWQALRLAATQSQYRTVLQRTQAADLYAKQQQLVVESQEEEIASLTEQLGSIDDITAQTVPMLLGMIEDLKVKLLEKLDGLDPAPLQLVKLQQLEEKSTALAQSIMGGVGLEGTAQLIVNGRPYSAASFAPPSPSSPSRHAVHPR